MTHDGDTRNAWLHSLDVHFNYFNRYKELRERFLISCHVIWVCSLCRRREKKINVEVGVATLYIWTNTCWHQIAVGGSQSTFKSCQSFEFFFLPFWHSSIRISLCDDLLAVLSVIINISEIISSPQFTEKLNIFFFVWNQSGEENYKMHASKMLFLYSLNQKWISRKFLQSIISKGSI